MAPKKVKKVKEVTEQDLDDSIKDLVEEVSIPTKIQPLSVDFNNEGLNNIARKINEIIDAI